MEKIKTVKRLNTLIKSSGILVVKVGSYKCPPCRSIKDKYEALTQDYNHIKMIEVETADSREVVKHLKVTKIPVFFVYVNGTLYYEVNGPNIQELKKILNSFNDNVSLNEI